MTDEQFQRLADLIEAQQSHLELLSQSVIGLIEHWHSGAEPAAPVDLLEEINALSDSLKDLKHKKHVALKFLRNS